MGATRYSQFVVFKAKSCLTANIFFIMTVTKVCFALLIKVSSYGNVGN